MATLSEDFLINNSLLLPESDIESYEDALNIEEYIRNRQYYSTDVRFNRYFSNENTETNTFTPFHYPVKIKIFDVIYPKNISLFTLLENNSSSKDVTFLKRKREKIKIRRRKNNDNIRKKIKRGFFNFALIKKLGEKLRSIGSRLNFGKSRQKFISNITKETNKVLIDMTLLEIFEKEELYEKDDSNYKHNLKVVKSEDVQDNAEFKSILNKKYSELFEEYINSKEFEDEIERLKEKKMEDDYIKIYINLAKHFIEYFSNQTSK